jgi:hypothetical protein
MRLACCRDAPPSRYGSACKYVIYVSAACESVCVRECDCAGALASVREPADQPRHTHAIQPVFSSCDRVAGNWEWSGPAMPARSKSRLVDLKGY